MDKLSFVDRARKIVQNYFNQHVDVTDNFELELGQVFSVWSCYILGNWKVLVSTTVPDGAYYEVTFNEKKKETYLDVYKKFDNVCLSDVLVSEDGVVISSPKCEIKTAVN